MLQFNIAAIKETRALRYKGTIYTSTSSGYKTGLLEIILIRYNCFDGLRDGLAAWPKYPVLEPFTRKIIARRFTVGGYASKYIKFQNTARS